MILSTVFADLIKIHGIEAAILYDRSNQILDQWLNTEFNKKLYEDIGLQFRQIFSLEHNISHQFPEVVLAYEKGQIYAKLHEEQMLIVITKKLVEVSLLRLVINVGFFNFDHSKEIQKVCKKNRQLLINFLSEDYLDDVEISFLKKIERHPME